MVSVAADWGPIALSCMPNRTKCILSISRRRAAVDARRHLAEAFLGAALACSDALWCSCSLSNG
jgi:hypothetical protein